jgi:hypothetical protein
MTKQEAIQKKKAQILERQAKELAKLDEQLKRIEIVSKSKNRIERLTLKVLAKHPELFAVNPEILEKSLDDSFAALAGNLKNRA